MAARHLSGDRPKAIDARLRTSLPAEIEISRAISKIFGIIGAK